MGNRLKDTLARGELALGVSVMVPSPQVVEMVARLGFGWVLIDCEHGAIGPDAVESMAMAAQSAGCVPIGRPGSKDPDAILRMMDRGVCGVQVPHVSTVEEARAVVSAVKFAPEGQRSLAVGTRSAGYGFGIRQDIYTQQSNRDTLVCVQIEDVAGLRNLEEIAAVPGVDVVFVGPSDLSQSLGVPGQHGAPTVVQTMADAFTRIQGRGRVSGTAGNAEALRRYRGLGVGYFYTHLTTLLQLGSDGFVGSGPIP